KRASESKACEQVCRLEGRSRLGGHPKIWLPGRAAMLANAPEIRDDPPMDDDAAGLLDGLQGPELEARRGLLALLRERGFDDQELVSAAAEDRLALLPVQRILGGRYTAAEGEQRTG